MINVPINRNAVQPVAHFMFGDSPDIDTKNAPIDNINPDNNANKNIAPSGKPILPLTLREDNLICKAGATNSINSGITRAIILLFRFLINTNNFKR